MRLMSTVINDRATFDSQFQGVVDLKPLEIYKTKRIFGHREEG